VSVSRASFGGRDTAHLWASFQIATARRASRLELLSVVRLGFTNRSVEDAALRWLSGYELGSLTLPAPFRHSIRMGYVFVAIRSPKGHIYSLAVAARYGPDETCG